MSYVLDVYVCVYACYVYSKIVETLFFFSLSVFNNDENVLCIFLLLAYACLL